MLRAGGIARGVVGVAFLTASCSSSSTSTVGLHATFPARRDRSTLTVLDVRTGKIRWTMPLRFAGANFHPVVSGTNVVVSGYAATDGSGNEPCRTPANQAFDASNGKQRWYRRGAALDRATVVGGVAISAIYGRGVFAHDARTGRALWQTTTIVPALPQPAFDEHSVYVLNPPYAPQYKLHSPPTYLTAIDARSGAIRWRASVPTRSAQAVLAGNVIVTTPYTAGTAAHAPGAFSGYDAQSGRLLWRKPSHSLEGAVAHGSAVYALVSPNRIVTIDAPTGTMHDAPKPSDVADLIGVADGVLVFGLPNGVAAVDPSNGRVLWSRSTRPVRLDYTFTTVAGSSIYSVVGFDCTAGD